MGLALMNRFDALLPAAVVGMGLLVASRRPRAVLAYGAVLLVTVSPWIAYSLLRHHTLFVSDNRLVALTAENIQVADWFATPPATVFTDPARYAGKIAHNLVWFFQDMQLTPKIDMLIVALAAGFMAWRRWGRGRGEGAVPLMPRASLVAVLILGLAIAAQCALYVATGYIDGRYFAVHRWFLVFVGLGILMPPLAERWRSATVALLSACTLLGVVGLYRHNPYIVPGETTQAVAEAERVYRCVGQAPGQTILFDHWGQQLAALKGTMVAGLPNNFGTLAPAERLQFVRRFRITHFHGADPATVLGPAVNATPVPGCPGVPLWRIVP